VTAKGDELPYVLLDSDKVGDETAASLRADLYKGTPDRIIQMESLCGFPKAEIEDLYPHLIAYVVSRYLPGPEEEFAEYVQPGRRSSTIEPYA
jgi:hypothetical protein